MLGAHQNKYRLRGWQVIALRWLAALLVLAVLLHFLPWEQLKDSVRRVPLTRFAVILAGYLLAHAVGSMKWRMVVNAAGAQLDYSTSVECYAGGLFATLFLPSIIGGDVVRLAVGLRRSPNPAAVLAGNIADRFLDVLAQVALVGIGLILLLILAPVMIVISVFINSAILHVCLMIVGGAPTEAAIRDVAASVQGMIDPGGSVHATADYQRHVAGVLTERALRTAHRRVRDGQ